MGLLLLFIRVAADLFILLSVLMTRVLVMAQVSLEINKKNFYFLRNEGWMLAKSSWRRQKRAHVLIDLLFDLFISWIDSRGGGARP